MWLEFEDCGIVDVLKECCEGGSRLQWVSKMCNKCIAYQSGRGKVKKKKDMYKVYLCVHIISHILLYGHVCFVPAAETSLRYNTTEQFSFFS